MTLGCIPGSVVLAAIAALWLVLAIVGPRLLENPRENVETGVVWWLMKVYARCVHRLKVVGREHAPAARRPGPLIVVANHTAGVDPVLIQAAVKFEVRFMMARDMQPQALEGLWKWIGVIGVDRQAKGGDMKSAREALRYLQTVGEVQADGTRSSGVIGIFPEGGIAKPAGTVMPFLAGVGLLVHRSGARVLPVVIRGTPRSDTAWGSLVERSHSVLEFLPTIDYSKKGMKPGEIAEDLRNVFLSRTGWRASEGSGGE